MHLLILTSNRFFFPSVADLATSPNPVYANKPKAKATIAANPSA